MDACSSAAAMSVAEGSSLPPAGVLTGVLRAPSLSHPGNALSQRSASLSVPSANLPQPAAGNKFRRSCVSYDANTERKKSCNDLSELSISRPAREGRRCLQLGSTSSTHEELRASESYLSNRRSAGGDRSERRALVQLAFSEGPRPTRPRSGWDSVTTSRCLAACTARGALSLDSPTESTTERPHQFV